jgi:hypothetical protein
MKYIVKNSDVEMVTHKVLDRLYGNNFDVYEPIISKAEYYYNRKRLKFYIEFEDDDRVSLFINKRMLNEVKQLIPVNNNDLCHYIASWIGKLLMIDIDNLEIDET